jgi:hypothetical protein
MLRTLRVTIAPEDVAAMRELLVTLRGVKAEAASRGLEEAAAELDALDALVEQAERPHDAAAPLELSGPPWLVRDAVYGLLLDGADALAEVCRAYEAGRSSLADLAGAGEAAARRVALMTLVEDRDRWSAD